MNVRTGIVAGALTALIAGNAWANEAGAEGRWRTISDTDGKPRSIVRIDEKAGTYEAVVEKIFFKAGEDTDPVCDKCTDARKGQKIIGLKIMNGLKRDGFAYEGGEILDPDNGKVYRAKMKLSPDGKTLEVRGFIGVSLFGRSQTWYRE
ncbi:DUF2147 domain-containing protein [Niveibacterium umoris]|uniref:Uncharacterized protein (DUF2147 family) n=1 Tax=Niveibacterium umoris TaxID=1193620 RepID=A0A840BR64_9RHOO|nr:DUF2147 domain-containing protein [Niveibacterium umoris]MBB4014162.1 uncharacterized protein (DUF2147 family) [Niveibacterium umoris]